jgi:hypothetical protein
MGFGCADAGGLDFNGAPAPPPGVPSITYPDFLKVEIPTDSTENAESLPTQLLLLQALDAEEVLLVEFLPPNGDIAYATLKMSDGIAQGLMRFFSKHWGILVRW